jgi:putative peptidoglycan lipid II flippase
VFAKKEEEGEKHLKEATNSIFTVFSFSIIFFCAVFFLLMPYVIKFSFSGLGAVAVSDITFLSRVLLLSPLLLGFSNFFGSIVQYEKRFILYSISPLLYNLGIIVGIYFGGEDLGIISAVLGVILGALLHLSLQAIYIFVSPRKPKLTLRVNWRDVREIAMLSVPRTLAVSIVSFVGFFFAILASKMAEGSIAIFNLSWNLQSAPISLIGVSFSLAAFPSLSVSAAKNKMDEVVSKISSGLRQIIFWSLPLTALIIILRAHLVRVVLGSGFFDWQSTRLVAGALALFVFSLVFQNILLFLSRSHYALGKTKWPLFANIFSGAFSVLLGLVFINYFSFFEPLFYFISEILKIEDLSSMIIVLPLAFSIGSIAGSVLIFLGLGKKMSTDVWMGFSGHLFKIFVSSSLLFFSSYYVLQLSDHLFNLDTFLGVFMHGALAGLSGIAVWAFSLYKWGDTDIVNIAVFIKNKIS